jgi:hypothetical protein
VGSHGRVQRVLEALTVATSRLAQCQMRSPVDDQTTAQLTDLSTRLQAAAKLRRAALQRDPDLSDQVMGLVFDIEALPATECGEASTDDRALQLIAQQRQPPTR